jgi:hypothetical protein
VQHNDARGPGKGGIRFAGRRQGRRHLRSAQSERPRTGADLPWLGSPGSQERRPAVRCPGARRYDQRAAHVVDPRRV